MLNKIFEQGSSRIRVSERITDWRQSIENLTATYPYGISHGLQKDAIQNSWDASKGKTRNYIKDNWYINFSLITLGNGIPALTITDEGTCGLTGE